MLAGVGSRFDFHMAKTLCDLRYFRLPAVSLVVDHSHAKGPAKFLILSSTSLILRGL